MLEKIKKKHSYFMVMLAGTLWGTTGTITKYIYEYSLNSLTLALLRIGISFFALLLYLVLTKQRLHLQKKDIPFFLAFGAVSVAGFNLFYLAAIQQTTVTTAVVLLYTAPAFSLIFARFFLHESLSVKKVLYLFLTFTGILLVVQVYQPGQLLLNASGVMYGLGAGVTYGIYSIFSKGALLRGYSPLAAVVLALGSGMLWLALVRPPWHLLRLSAQPWQLWGLIALVSLVSTMLAYVFFVAGLEHVEAGKATLVAAVEPVVAIFLAAVFLAERMNIWQYLGIFIVLAAVVAQSLPQAQPPEHINEDK